MMKRERWHVHGGFLDRRLDLRRQRRPGRCIWNRLGRRRRNRQPTALRADIGPGRHDRFGALDGAGAYLAVKSQREVYEAEIGRERHEVEEDPAEEVEEMTLVLSASGF